MHTHPINASIQLVPIQDADKAMGIIDEAIALIRTSGLAYEVGPFGTSVEGAYEEVMALIHRINAWMVANSSAEWVLNIQLHIAPAQAVTMQQKTAKHR